MSFTQIPNEAIDRMKELSAGALRLYLFLARCRNTKSGQCNPSVDTTAEAIGVHKRNIFRLRNELAAAGWARFDGNTVTALLGGSGGKNTTKNVESIEDIPITEETGKNATTLTVSTGKNATKYWQKRQLKVAKMPVAYKEEQYERTILKEQDELIHVAVAPVVLSDVQQVFAYWQCTLNHPTAKLTPKRKKLIQARLKDYTLVEIKKAIDGCASSPFHMGQNETGTVYDDIELICRNGEKLEGFISRSNSNGRHEIPRKETLGERNAREYEELIRNSAAAYAPSDGNFGTDTENAGAQGVPIDIGGY